MAFRAYYGRIYYGAYLKLGDAKKLMDSIFLSPSVLYPERGVDLGEYRIKKKLGEGGMGIVFLAVHRESNEKVAMKVLRSRQSQITQEERQRFKREIRTLERLKHSNVVQILNASSVNYEGVYLPYYTMEYILGQPLTHYLQTNRSVAWAIDTIIQVGCGLTYIHEQNVLHRDLKPANIIIDEDCAKVLDFGLCKIFDSIDSLETSSNVLFGTPQYMAPEQFFSPQQAGKQSDLYSLAAILYHLLMDEPPTLIPTDFPRGEQNQTSLQEFFLQPFQVDFSQRRQLDPDIEEICRKALSYNRAKRYSCVKEFTQELRNYRSQREKMTYHFLLGEQETYLIEKKLALNNTSGTVCPCETSSSGDLCKILSYDGKCELFIYAPLSVNHKQYSTRERVTLADGDQIQVAGNRLYYKKQKSKNFYNK